MSSRGREEPTSLSDQGVRRVLRILRRVPSPATLARHKTAAIAAVLALAALSYWGAPQKQIWIFDEKDPLVPLCTIAGLALLYGAVWSLRLALDKRPVPVEREQQIRELADAIFHPPRPGEPAR